jgi:hypothetical protein
MNANYNGWLGGIYGALLLIAVCQMIGCMDNQRQLERVSSALERIANKP